MADRPSARSILASFFLIAGTITAGLALRLLPLGLPPPVTKHGGSLLWAAMVYWIVSTVRPRWPRPATTLVACAVTTGIELSQLLHWPPLDAFRRTPIGALLLGRVFAAMDLAVYAVAVVIASQLDNYLRPKQRTG